MRSQWCSLTSITAKYQIEILCDTSKLNILYRHSSEEDHQTCGGKLITKITTKEMEIYWRQVVIIVMGITLIAFKITLEN